ncbi:MAG TPA: hypothetical protein VLA23_11915 [Candidatus Limnocylindrales bacterium]|nr:hypothetical protein [Candidatus Limnocylindrales bacterium]
MLDTNSRYIVASRTIDDRLAEVRRAHVLRESQAGQDAPKVHRAVVPGPSLLDRLSSAVGALASSARPARPARPAPTR